MTKFLMTLLCIGLSVGQLFAQNRTITGSVTDPEGNPLVGATINVAGSSVSVATGAGGTFSIGVPTTAKELLVSFVGYGTKRVSIGSQQNYNVTLTNSTVDLNTVVVTGYSRIKKSEYAGAGSKVTAEQINFVPAASFDQMLQGRAPGLLVTSGSGQPGAASRVQIRGAASITGGNAPLYILDGQPVEEGVFQSLNPADFESIDVLRDAVATAQYGNRGASGVIVVTTKRGKAGKPVLSYAGQVGITEAGEQKFNMMTSEELLRFQEILGQQLPNNLPGWANSKLNPSYATASPAVKAQRGRNLDSLRNINTNWRDVFIQQGSFQNHNLSLSGGSEATRFFLSGSYYKEDGIGLRSDLTRYNLRANIDHKSDKLTIQFNSGIGYTTRNFIESENGIALANPFAAAYLALPYQKLYNDNGTVSTGSGRVGPNAFARVTGTSQLNNQIKATSSTLLNYDITNHFFVGGSAGIDYRQTVNERSIYPGSYAANNTGFPTGPAAGSSTGGGSYGEGYNNFMEYVIRANAGYKNTFAEKHDVFLQVISEYTKDNLRGFNYTGFGINPKLVNTPAGITPGNNTNNLIARVGGFKNERALYAAMALGRYTYKGKYTLNASFRRDGSSQLPIANRFTNFYAVGGIWDVMKEGFAENWNKVSDLRLRVSYGTAANADGFPGGYFSYLPTFGAGSYAGQGTIEPSAPGNANLKWERIATANIGLDYAFFKNRIRGKVDVYNKKGTDVIVSQKIPLETGFGSLDVNAATVGNKGVEVELSADVIRSKDFVWTIGGNFSYNKNEVLNLGQVNEFEQGTEIVRVGLPIGSHYIVKWGGVDAASGKPLYYTKAGKLTDFYSDDDRVADFGTYNAPWIGGFTTNIRFKGFTIDALFSFQQGFQRFNNQDFFQLNHAFALQGFNLRREMLTIWQRPGDVTDIQNPLTQRQFVSKDIQDASFLRFRNLSVSYDLPRSLLGNQKFIGSLRIFGQAQNLYTWTNWTGFDPEDNDNIAAYEYPTPRTYTLGLNVSFK